MKAILSVLQKRQKKNTDFHSDTYGPICFHFKENPLKQDKNEFLFVQAPVYYMDTKKLNLIFDSVQDIFNVFLLKQFEIIDTHHELDVLLRELRKALLNSPERKSEKSIRKKLLLTDASKVLNEVSGPRKQFIEQVSRANPILTKVHVPTVIDYFQARVTSLREQKILNKNSLESQRDLWKHGIFRHDNTEGHLQNLISCFIKDIEFKDDNEIRVIALPIKGYDNPDNHILKSTYDINKLSYISVSSNYPNRENAIKELKDLLSSLNHSHVEVI